MAIDVKSDPGRMLNTLATRLADPERLRRLNLLEQEGVKFVCSTEVGVNYPADKLLKEFDAVVLATGATKPRDLPIEGRSLGGVTLDLKRDPTPVKPASFE